MDSVKYPGHLNPFGDDEQADIIVDPNDYPDYLDPFGDESIHRGESSPESVVEYDDSLNPFGDETDKESSQILEGPEYDVKTKDNPTTPKDNPFDNEVFDEVKRSEIVESNHVEVVTIDGTETANNTSLASQPQSLESIEPPKPLPRTKSLLKKELASRRRRQEQQSSHTSSKIENDSINLSNNHESSNSIPNSAPNATNQSVGSFQKKKNKRVAPPVPVNFKRQVSGSLDAIEEELNGIGDQLAIIEKESNLCQDLLKSPEAALQADFQPTKSKFIELIKRKNSIVRRQKELMYQKRELKLDQIHSDIEYELRMIGNKQLSTRTPEDEAKERELLKRLVEIVEEKSDIVENLNKDSYSDTQDVEEAFKRLNLVESLRDKRQPTQTKRPPGPPPQPPSAIAPRNANCDKSNLNKLSKIATLLPRSNSLKSTMKIKRKRFFKKKCDSQAPVEK